MQTINCEITKVFDPNDKGVGFVIKPNEATDELKALTKWNNKFQNITATWWFNQKAQPKWIVEEAKIKFSWYEKNGFLNIDQASVEVIELPNIEDEFNDAINELDDSFDTDQLEAEALKDLEQKDKSNVTNLKPKAINNNINSKKLSKIQELTDNYGDVFKVVNSHPNLVSLPLEEKTKITTHINITLSQQGY